MARLALSVLLVGAVAVGCGGGGKAAGTERGPCYGNGTCNTGLVCLSDLCVSPGGLNDGGMDAGSSDGGMDAGPDGSFNPFAICDPRTQVGCDPGQACILGLIRTDGGTVEGAGCFPAGSVAVGQPCTSSNDCVAGAGCLGECFAYCDPASASTCIAYDPLKLVGVSLTACNAFTQDCGAGSACVYADTATVCLPVGNAPPDTDGADCSSTLTCAAGLQCVLEGSDAGTTAVCRRFCDTMSPSACSSCTSVESIEGGPAPDVPDNLGICSTSATQFFL